jgi:hypothetical protein
MHPRDRTRLPYELGRELLEAVTEAPVPADMRAQHILKHSPLTLDMFTLAIQNASWRSSTSKTNSYRVMPYCTSSAANMTPTHKQLEGQNIRDDVAAFTRLPCRAAIRHPNKSDKGIRPLSGPRSLILPC